MRKTYRVRYERLDGFYSCVQTTAANPKQAAMRVREYLAAEGIIFKCIDEVYLVSTGEERRCVVLLTNK